MYPYRIAEIVHTVIPYMVKQLFLTDGPTLIEQQVFKYPDFLSGKRQLLSAGYCDTGLSIKGKLTACKNYIILCKLTAGKTAYRSFSRIFGDCSKRERHC